MSLEIELDRKIAKQLFKIDVKKQLTTIPKYSTDPDSSKLLREYFESTLKHKVVVEGFHSNEVMATLLNENDELVCNTTYLDTKELAISTLASMYIDLHIR